ncbi:hypothetical protein DPMN_000726 [Dreissena polymorpha]|uniref:Uncharacterized protein n=1 Tax=Dreissena polymorpha TaxID=45954 RepID=A0A9D4MGE2_DREPO|nr:hypothetical protein DPMN_000726 [Dreissena polymorpha]
MSRSSWQFAEGRTSLQLETKFRSYYCGRICAAFSSHSSAAATGRWAHLSPTTDGYLAAADPAKTEDGPARAANVIDPRQQQQQQQQLKQIKTPLALPAQKTVITQQLVTSNLPQLKGPATFNRPVSLTPEGYNRLKQQQQQLVQQKLPIQQASQSSTKFVQIKPLGSNLTVPQGSQN